MRKRYDDHFKQQMVKLYLSEGRTYRSLQEEYEVDKATLRTWVKAGANNLKCLFIHDNKQIFGVLWLCRRFKMSPNVYYYWVKNTKSNAKKLKKTTDYTF